MWILITAIIVIVIATIIYYATKKQPELDFTGKHILITGGSSGIGENLAYLFARLGAYLTLASNQPEDVKNV